MIQASQIRSARALLGWTQDDLASAAKVAIISVKRVEAGAVASSATLAAIETALTKAGVVLLDSGAASLQGGYGVRLKR